MKYFRLFVLLVLLAVVITACGRRLPEEYFETNTDFATESVDTVAMADDAADETSGTDIEVQSDAIDVVDETAETTEEAPAEEVSSDTESDTETTGVETSSEPVVELVPAPMDPIIEQVANADPANGEVLLTSGVPCSSCHRFDSEEMLVGPGLLNIPTRAENRIEDVVAERYLYNSILHPNEYVVDGYAEGVMPSIYADTYTESDVLDVVAYLMTLGEYPEREPAFIEVVVEPAPESDVVADVEVDVVEDTTEAADTTDDVATDDETTSETVVDTSETEDTEATTGDIDLSNVPERVEFLAEHGSAIQGSALFNSQLANGMSCATCHTIDGTSTSTQSDVSSVATRDNAAAYAWAAIFNTQFHPGLGSQYQQTLSGAETSHLVSYLLSLAESETE